MLLLLLRLVPVERDLEASSVDLIQLIHIYAFCFFRTGVN